MKKSGISYSVTRRRFLRDATLTSLGIVAAACTPGATPGTSPSGGTASTKGGEFHGAWPYDLPPKGHYNYFASSGIILQSSVYLDLFIPSLAGYRWADAKWEYWLAESSSLNGNVFEVKLRPNIKWSDGTPFTSKDVVSTVWAARIMRNVIWQYIDSVNAVDNATVSFHMIKPSTILERYVLRQLNPLSDVHYGDWASGSMPIWSLTAQRNFCLHPR